MKGQGDAASTMENEQQNDYDDTSIILDLVVRAKTLLSELETFKNRLRFLRQEGVVELATFRGTVQAELVMLEKLSSQPQSGSTQHVARSSNLLFLETVWTEAKRTRNLASLQKRIYPDKSTKALSQGMRHISLDKVGRKHAFLPIQFTLPPRIRIIAFLGHNNHLALSKRQITRLVCFKDKNI